MDTLWMLTGRYQGLPIVPVETVIADFFPHLNRQNFLRKVADGSLKLPVINIEAASQKTAKGVHLTDLAAYLDERRADAMQDFARMHG